MFHLWKGARCLKVLMVFERNSQGICTWIHGRFFDQLLARKWHWNMSAAAGAEPNLSPICELKAPQMPQVVGKPQPCRLSSQGGRICRNPNSNPNPNSTQTPKKNQNLKTNPQRSAGERHSDPEFSPRPSTKVPGFCVSASVIARKARPHATRGPLMVNQTPPQQAGGKRSPLAVFSKERSV